ncbi:MAG: VOC family protein [Anaerolineaceae bacterium]|nr:VOC family protein [Anaerolineaceae bacterium]
MQKISTCLWFDDNAEEAVNFYTSIFKNSKITSTSRYSEAGPGKPGSVMTMTFTLEEREFMVINGGPVYKFSPAISMLVNCVSQEEVDHFWEQLSDGGEEMQCGWVTDRFGLTWQIVPTLLGELMSDPDPVKVARVAEAMLKMVKLDCNLLQKAYDQS